MPMKTNVTFVQTVEVVRTDTFVASAAAHGIDHGEQDAIARYIAFNAADGKISHQQCGFKWRCSPWRDLYIHYLEEPSKRINLLCIDNTPPRDPSWWKRLVGPFSEKLLIAGMVEGAKKGIEGSYRHWDADENRIREGIFSFGPTRSASVPPTRRSCSLSSTVSGSTLHRELSILRALLWDRQLSTSWQPRLAQLFRDIQLGLGMVKRLIILVLKPHTEDVALMIYGEPGSGKSSVMNAILPRQLAESAHRCVYALPKGLGANTYADSDCLNLLLLVDEEARARGLITSQEIASCEVTSSLVTVQLRLEGCGAGAYWDDPSMELIEYLNAVLVVEPGDLTEPSERLLLTWHRRVGAEATDASVFFVAQSFTDACTTDALAQIACLVACAQRTLWFNSVSPALHLGKTWCVEAELRLQPSGCGIDAVAVLRARLSALVYAEPADIFESFDDCWKVRSTQAARLIGQDLTPSLLVVNLCDIESMDELTPKNNERWQNTGKNTHFESARVRVALPHHRSSHQGLPMAHEALKERDGFQTVASVRDGCFERWMKSLATLPRDSVNRQEELIPD